MTDRRHARLLRQFVELMAWQVEAHQMPADQAQRALEDEGLRPERAQQIVLQAINRRLPTCSKHC